MLWSKMIKNDDKKFSLLKITWQQRFYLNGVPAFTNSRIKFQKASRFLPEKNTFFFKKKSTKKKV